MTHGCQTTAEQQMRANLYNQLAEREGFVVMYPDVDAEAASRTGPLARCWRFYESESWHRDAGDAAAIAGMTRETMGSLNIDPERVYAMGMSAGGFMTSILAAAYPTSTPPSGSWPRAPTPISAACSATPPRRRSS